MNTIHTNSSVEPKYDSMTKIVRIKSCAVQKNTKKQQIFKGKC